MQKWGQEKKPSESDSRLHFAKVLDEKWKLVKLISHWTKLDVLVAGGSWSGSQSGHTGPSPSPVRRQGEPLRSILSMFVEKKKQKNFGY